MTVCPSQTTGSGSVHGAQPMFTMVELQMEVLVSYFSLDHCVFLPLSNQAQGCHVLSRDSWATRL